jgi:hypothetical protein
VDVTDDEVGDEAHPGDPPPREDDVAPGSPAPGSPEAVRRGCRCSVLLNQAPVGGHEDAHFVNPLCPLDHSGAAGSGPPTPP